MFGMGPTYEAFAHFAHGGATVFFMVFSVFTWPMRKQNRMMYLLFLNMLYLAFCNCKDMVFLFGDLWYDPYVTGLSVMTDLIYVPIMSSFFLEVVSPGFMTNRRIWSLVGPQILFLPLFIAFPSDLIYRIALYFSYLVGITVMLLVVIQSVRHRRFIKENYSFTEHIDVSWTVGGGIAVFLCMTIYLLVFSDETWLGNAVYYLMSFLGWVYLYFSSLKHQVVEVPQHLFFNLPWDSSEKDTDAISAEIKEHSEDVYAFIERGLAKCMGEDKLYLNPKLSIQDVSSAIGTNRTYLSAYLNSELKVSFYDYVNSLRIKEACSVINENKEKISMQEVSDRSGFNSISTFNRSFTKYVGMTPSQYASRKR